jgi:hypothetical protein
MNINTTDDEKEAREKCKCAEETSNVDEIFLKRKHRWLVSVFSYR